MIVVLKLVAMVVAAYLLIVLGRDRTDRRGTISLTRGSNAGGSAKGTQLEKRGHWEIKGGKEHV